jgi:ABC-type dipeptide/oligopeptide/nickel transport system permease subunit
MIGFRNLACVLLLAIVGASLVAPWIARASYETQFRDELPNAGPSRAHWLGTDDLGRDRFARVLYGTRVSLLLAPAAALLSTVLAGGVGGLAGYLGGRWERLAMASADLFLSMPWLFLLLMVRAMLPLNVSPLTSVMVTFLLLGMLGWAASARVLCAGARDIRNSDFVLLARASGVGKMRVLLLHVVPNLKPALLAQFWISIPVFILSEANLGILGLGVTEPLPSWGSLLRELESFANFSGEYWRLAPLAVLVLTVTSFQILLSREKEVAA